MFNLFLRPYAPGFSRQSTEGRTWLQHRRKNDGSPMEAGTRPYLDEVQTQTPPIVTPFTLGFGWLDAIGSTDRNFRHSR